MDTFTVDRDELAAVVREALAGLDIRTLVRATAERVHRDEVDSLREAHARAAFATEEAARATKAALMLAARRHGYVSLRYTSDAAPEALRWIPVLPPGSVRR